MLSLHWRMWSVGLRCLCEEPLTRNKWIKCMKRSLSWRVEGVSARIWTGRVSKLCSSSLLFSTSSHDHTGKIMALIFGSSISALNYRKELCALSLTLSHTHIHIGEKEAKMTSRVKNVTDARRIICLTPHLHPVEPFIFHIILAHFFHPDKRDPDVHICLQRGM